MQATNVIPDQQGAAYESVDELAKEIGLGRQSTYEALRNGLIPCIRIGKRFVIPRVAISAWLKTAAGKLS